MLHTPLISILIPTYNRAKLIEETLDSILKQTYKNWECIIIDDGSIDNTNNIVTDYIKKDKRFKYFSRPSNKIKGACSCRNYGFEISKGEYINWFDSDDIMLPSFLEKKMEVFNNYKYLDVVFSYGAYFEDSISKLDISKPKINDVSILDYVKSDFYLITHGPLWKRSFLNDKDLFDEKRSKLQDTEFHFRMLLKEPKFEFYEVNHLFLIRRGSERVSAKETLSLKKVEDVFLYHYLTFSKFDFIIKEDQKKYIEITQKKSLRSYYEIIIFNNSFLARLNTYFKYFYKVNRIINKNTSLVGYLKKHLIIVIITIAKKGYKLL